MTEEKVDVVGGSNIIFGRCLFRVRTHGGRRELDAAVLLQLHSAIGSVGSIHEVAWVGGLNISAIFKGNTSLFTSSSK